MKFEKQWMMDCTNVNVYTISDLEWLEKLRQTRPATVLKIIAN